MSKLSYKSLLIIFSFLLIGVIVLAKFVLPNNKVKAAWWNDGWNYRKAISISNTSGSNLTDFQVSISVGTSALIASGKMQTDCDDIRITDQNGNLLSYWIEPNTCNTENTKILLNLKTFSTTGNTVFFYYGNSSIEAGNDPSIIPKTCSDVNAFLGTGLFYVDSDGINGNNPTQAYCDQTTNGGGWTLVASWATAQEWTKTSTSTSAVFDTTAKNAVSSNFGNASIYDFRVLASDAITTTGGSAYADWFYHYNTATTWKEVWAPTANLGGALDSTYRSTSPRQALRPFNYSYNIKFNYQVAQTWNNLSDWAYTGADKAGCLPNYWAALTTSGNPFGVFSLAYYSGSNGTGCASAVSDGSLGICPSDQPGCNTGQDRATNNVKIGYDDGGAQAGFGSIGTTSVGETPGVQATTKLWWFIREDTPANISYSFNSPTAEEAGGGPIAYWKFDEGVGTTAYDSTGNFPGVLSGSTLPSWQNEDNCISGKCLNYSGSGYINSGNSTNFRIQNNSITLETWVNFSYLDYTNNTGALLSLMGKGNPDRAPGTSSTGFWLTYDNRNNRNSFNYTCFGNSAGGYAGGNNNFSGYNYTFSPNIWYHIVVTISENQGRLYINGKQFGSTKTFTGLQLDNTSDNLFIGKANAGFNIGLQDEVKIYPYARTPDQIKQDYNSRGSLSGSSANLGVQSNTAPSLKSSLVAYWKFDENNGTSVYDSSGNNHTGSFVGTTKPTWQNGKYKSGIGFSGVNDSISLPYQPNFRNAFSVSIWFKRTTDYNQTSDIMLLSPANAWYFYDSYNSGAIRGDVYIDGTRRAGINVPIPFDGNWYHVVYTYDSATHTSKMYKNGKLYQSVDLTSLGLSNYLVDPPTGNLYNLGSNSKGRGIIVDEAKIYNKAITDQEVLQDYNQGSAIQFGSTNQTIGGTTTSLDYCIPGDTTYCTSPVAEWNFEENTGTSTKDVSGNNFIGSFNTGSYAPIWTLGKKNIGAGIKLNGESSSSYISTQYPATAPNSYTAEAWINPNSISGTGEKSTHGYTIMSASADGSRYPIWITLRNGEIRSSAFAGSLTYGETVGANIQTNQWYHIAVSAIQNGNVTIYVNGIGKTSFTASNTNWSVADKLTIGDLRPDRNISFNGKIDNVKIYNYARTPAQIAYDYNKGAPIGWWKLDECQGNIANDSSGVGNSGTIVIGSSGTQNSLGTCQIGTSAAWTNGASGKINGSLNFDGTDDYATIPNIISGDDTHTISFWVKPKDFNKVWLDMSGDSGYSFIEPDFSHLYVGYSPTTSLYRTYNYTFTLGNWYHITIVKTGAGDNVNVYINGILQTSYTGTVGNMNGGSIMYLGKFHTGSYNTNGQIDDVRIYNYALTAEQIKQLYNGGAVSFN